MLSARCFSNEKKKKSSLWLVSYKINIQYEKLLHVFISWCSTYFRKQSNSLNSVLEKLQHNSPSFCNYLINYFQRSSFHDILSSLGSHYYLAFCNGSFSTLHHNANAKAESAATHSTSRAMKHIWYTEVLRLSSFPSKINQYCRVFFTLLFYSILYTYCIKCIYFSSEVICNISRCDSHFIMWLFVSLFKNIWETYTTINIIFSIVLNKQ